jgi:hypothetical protein
LPSEYESAVAAWLDDPDAKREVAILKGRFPHWHDSAIHLFAIQVEILSGLDFYGDRMLSLDEPEETTDDDDEEPWKQGDGFRG